MCVVRGGRQKLIKSHPSPLHTKLIQAENLNCDRQEQAATADQEQQIEENDQLTSHEEAPSRPNLWCSYCMLCR